MLKTVILCALYIEAEPLIRKMNLKEEKILKGFQTFSDAERNVVLTVCGSGKIRGAAACGAIMQNDSWNQLILFSGCAGLKGQKEGDVYLVNKVTDLENGMSYYPDLLYACDLPETSLLSGCVPYGTDRKNREIRKPYDAEKFLQDPSLAEYGLYDMDASGVVLTAGKYFGPHQITVLKTVTDHGSLKDEHAYQKCMEEGFEKAFPYLEMLISHERKPADAFADLEKTACELHCSATMKAQLKQLFRYAEASGQNIKKIMKEYDQNGVLPCKTREEGKKVLHELTKRLTA